jgi:quinol monooxygenase YgiN
MIIFRTTMNVFLDKRTEVMQTLLSMIEPIENVRGCLSCHVFRDIEEKNVFCLEQKAFYANHCKLKSTRFPIRKEWRPLRPPGG